MKLVDNFHYYVKHHDELVAKYDGRWIVLNNCKVQGDFDTMDEAQKYGREHFGSNKFIIYQVAPGKENYTITYHPRVCVAPVN
jgi:hypothetical protein